MAREQLLTFTDRGIYCAAGGFYVDPWKPVSRAVITHGHSDHARPGHGVCLCHDLTAPILRLRLGNVAVEALPYGKPRRIGGVTVSLHPAGHIPGSAQVRIERDGEIWVVAGDYKLHDDSLSEPWEPVACHAFITESTFGLPIFRWPDQESVVSEIRDWWDQNRTDGKTSILTAYSLGKAQRLLHLLANGDGEILVHAAIRQVNSAYRAAGLKLDDFETWADADSARLSRALLIVPPAAAETVVRLVRAASTASASGWMAIRGNRRRRALDRGFVLSDHADWPELNRAIAETGTERIFVTHGQIDPFVRWLREQGRDAHPVPTRFTGDLAEETATEENP